MVGGRRWRASDPSIPEALRQELVDELMGARRALAADGRVEVTQKGERLDPTAPWKGPVRIRATAP